MAETQGTCVCATGEGSHCHCFVHRDAGCAELQARQFRQDASAVQRSLPRPLLPLSFPAKVGDSGEQRAGACQQQGAGCGRPDWAKANCTPLGAGTLLFQDTVVALQALSLYGAATYAKSGAASRVTLRSAGDFQHNFQVDPTNRLLLQRLPLPRVPGQYSTEVSGEGCVYLQVRVMRGGDVLGGEPLPGRSQVEGRKEGREGQSGREGSGRGKRRTAERCGGERVEWKGQSCAARRSCENGRGGQAGWGCARHTRTIL